MRTAKPAVHRISLNLEDKYHAYIVKTAKDDMRQPNNWLQKRVQDMLDCDIGEEAERVEPTLFCSEQGEYKKAV